MLGAVFFLIVESLDVKKPIVFQSVEAICFVHLGTEQHHFFLSSNQLGDVSYANQLGDLRKDLYKTVWEIKQRRVLDMAADRGAYIDQSQSLNIHMVNATTAKLSSMHFHGWEQGAFREIFSWVPRNSGK